jgi:hypothetical protein
LFPPETSLLILDNNRNRLKDTLSTAFDSKLPFEGLIKKLQAAGMIVNFARGAKLRKAKRKRLSELFYNPLRDFK